MKNREEIITSMCYTWRHDYGIVKDSHGHAWEAGMTQDERSFLYHQMAQIFDNDIEPFMKFKKDRKPRRMSQDKSIKSELGFSRVGRDAMRRG